MKPHIQLQTGTLRAIAAYGKALDDARELIEPESAETIPYLGRIPVFLDGDLIGHLDDPDGIGWDFIVEVPDA